jgi:hypothetical protein
LCTVSTVHAVGTIGTVTRQESLGKLSSGSELVALYSEPAYNYPIYVLNLHGNTPYDQGYDGGVLFGKQIAENYQSLFDSLLGGAGKFEEPLQELTEMFLDWQWNEYLSKDVPEQYMDELRGLTDGGIASDAGDVGILSSRGITLANLPGDVQDIIFVLIDEFINTADLTATQRLMAPNLKKVFRQYKGHQCSMFGIWGSRTEGGQLFSARNLDWLTDLGINKYKLLTIHHPADGNAHVTIGFAGIWGAMAGMSVKGLTLHEANLEEKLSSFQGFPWILRLRHVMAYSNNLNDALNIFATTNNTVGFNFMVGSASDKSARCLETMSGYTAVFADNDEREQNAIDPQTGEVYGFPMQEAVYRTNHGYDSITQKYYQWYGYSAYEDSKRRYNDFYKLFTQYHDDNVLVGPQEAVTVCATAGHKGDGSDEYNCNPDLYLEGSNIMSITFDPSQLILYTAFEDGSGENWVPAACNGYIKVDMKQWL